jgi:hypothetical protein
MIAFACVGHSTSIIFSATGRHPRCAVPCETQNTSKPKTSEKRAFRGPGGSFAPKWPAPPMLPHHADLRYFDRIAFSLIFAVFEFGF